MGIIAELYKFQYSRIYEITESQIEENAESSLEIVRDVTYEGVLSVIIQKTATLSKLDLELMRVDSIKQLNEVKEDISDTWRDIVHKTTIAALTYNYISYALIMPTFILLLLNQVLASQICAIVSFLLILLINFDPVRNTISYYLYGVANASNQLEELYVSYGSLEAVITAADYREIYHVDRNHWVYSDHHQKELPS